MAPEGHRAITQDGHGHAYGIGLRGNPARLDRGVKDPLPSAVFIKGSPFEIGQGLAIREKLNLQLRTSSLGEVIATDSLRSRILSDIGCERDADDPFFPMVPRLGENDLCRDRFNLRRRAHTGRSIRSSVARGIPTTEGGDANTEEKKRAHPWHPCRRESLPQHGTRFVGRIQHISDDVSSRRIDIIGREWSAS